jgi:DNA modification methylase
VKIEYIEENRLEEFLRKSTTASLDFIVCVTGAIITGKHDVEAVTDILSEGVRTLKDGGLLFVQGLPSYLPDLGVFLDKYMNFKYWVAVESVPHNPTNGLPSVHAGLLIFSKGNTRFNIQRTRFPHQYCEACGRTLKDWGGKAHLMHPDGYVVSDVWKDLPKEDNYTQLSTPVLETILGMIDFDSQNMEGVVLDKSFTNTRSQTRGIIIPREGIARFKKQIAESKEQYYLPGFYKRSRAKHEPVQITRENLLNVIHQGDTLEILKQYPDNSIDLVFADPPYNLDKEYGVYEDELDDKKYISWCNEWLEEYVRILKPTGSLFVLNLPRWSMCHAEYLNKRLYFQNWIAWDALSEPRGKLMPAHYGLLFYTKHPTNFTFNYHQVGTLDARKYCLRASCIKKRKEEGIDDKDYLNDIWWDIHRIKHQRDRDYHPCQLPDALMERIILLSTNEGDVVLDTFIGTGTTAIVAAKHGRNYVGIDIDEQYVKITKEKLNQLKENGFIERKSIKKKKKEHTKKELQLELRKLATELGRLPTQDDVVEFSSYELDIFLKEFLSWGKALKAAKLEVVDD